MANFYRRFLEAVERAPDAVAVEMQRRVREEPSPPERYSYLRLRSCCDRVGRWLQDQKTAPGTRCALLAQNGPRWIAAYLGTIAAGAVAVPLDTNFNAEQVAKLLKDSGSSLLFVDRKNLSAAKRAVEGSPVRLFLLERCPDGAEFPDFDSVAEAPETFAPALAGDEETAVIVYTSGTTSDPKGVMLTHGGLAAEREAVFRMMRLGPSDALLGVLPLFHVLSQMANLLLPLSSGARTVFLESTSSAELVRALRESRITIFVCVPQFFYLIHERIHREAAARGRLALALFRAMLRAAELGRRAGLNPGKIFFRPVHRMLGLDMRFLVTGGARMDPEVCRDFANLGFEMLQAYGLSETTGAVFATPLGRNAAGSVGLPMQGVRIKLLDPKPSEDAGGRAVGEIAISSPTLMKGYYNRPEATAEVLKDGWLLTGDLGYRDDDGNLFIAGRRKEMIVLSSGKNIYPEEIEAHYLKCPFIKEMCVLGLHSRPGEPFSERLHGVIVPNFDVLRERKIVNTLEAIRFDLETLSAELPAAKRILSYDLWQEELPRTTTRKIKRFEVDKRVRARHDAAKTGAGGEAAARELSPEESEWAARPQVARSLSLIRGLSKNPRARIHPRDNIELDLGFDSVERVELLAALERELGAHVRDWSLISVFTVRELVDVVCAHIGAPGSLGAGKTWDAILAAGTEDPDALAIIERRPISDRAWWALFLLLNLIARVFFRLRVDGLEKLPKKGPFIICPNHQSYLDAPVLLSVFPLAIFRRLFSVGTSEIFGAGPLRRLARALRLIPIDPDVNMVSAMKAGAYGLSQGRILILFPEGERSMDGDPKTFKKGAAILSAHLRVPIVPAALEGFYEAWPRDKGPRSSGRLRIVFGDPIPPPERAEGDADYAAMTAALKKSVMDLWLPLHRREAAG